MAGDRESRFGVLAGFVACVLILTLTLMAFAPGVAPTVFQTMSLKPVSLDLPAVPLPTETPSFALDETV